MNRQLRLLFVDDMEARHTWIDRLVLELGLNWRIDVVHTYSAKDAIRWLKRPPHADHIPFDIVSLDHDMTDKHYTAYHLERSGDGIVPADIQGELASCGTIREALERLYQDGSGAEVAQCIAQLWDDHRDGIIGNAPPPNAVILHSWNGTGVERMRSALRDTPYDSDELITAMAHSAEYVEALSTLAARMS